MDKPRTPLSLEAFVPVLAQTMKFATQALAHQNALAELLVKKRIVTRSELDEQMKKNPPQTKTLLDLLGTFDPSKRKPS
jgi:hypothetical protein